MSGWEQNDIMASNKDFFLLDYSYDTKFDTNLIDQQMR